MGTTDLRAVPAWEAEKPEPAGGVAEVEFAVLKDELLGEMLRGRRIWFYHPAWMAAASVVFVCSLLIHFSPRYGWRHGVAPAAAAPAVLRDREDKPGTPASSGNRIGSLERLPAAAPRQRPEAAPSEPRLQSSLSEAEAWTKEMESVTESKIWLSGLTIASSPLPVAIFLSPPVAVAQLSEAPPISLSSHMLEASPSPPIAAAGALSDAPGAAAPLRRQAAGRSAGPVLVDLFNQADPPQFVPRPPPIDADKLARDLAVLAVMQIGHGELAEARLSIGMLVKYDAEKADELTRVLAAKEAEMAAAEAAANLGADPEEKSEAVVVNAGSIPSGSAMDAAMPSAAPVAEPAAPVEASEVFQPESVDTAEDALVEDMFPAHTETPVFPDVSTPSIEPTPVKRPIFSTDPYIRGD